MYALMKIAWPFSLDRNYYRCFVVFQTFPNAFTRGILAINITEFVFGIKAAQYPSPSLSHSLFNSLELTLIQFYYCKIDRCTLCFYYI